MSRFDAILLDYGNTVVQFDRPQIEWIHVQLAEVLSRTVAPIKPRMLGEVMDRVCVLPPLSTDKREFTPFEQMLQILREAYDGTFPVTDQMVTEANCEYQNLYVHSIKIDDSAVRALEWIRRKVRVGLVSNYPCGASLRRSLHSTGIADLLDPVVVSGDVGYVKPHPKLFEAALDAVGVPAGRVLFVGDNWASDMVGAHTAGMVTCHHLGHTSEQDYEERYQSYRPDFSIHHLEELQEIVTAG
ncbi:MAG TPA: HAD family hydrolase [Pseudonocardiaceae bacterium]|jgi:putative hydrolase of the HAD superfamily|nr:HAD family hydrolase [Pseudonocardiaceae bacterium]